MAIGLSHGGTNVYSSKERARQLWVATKDGLVLYERADDGKWREARRALRGQHISSIIFEPTHFSRIHLSDLIIRRSSVGVWIDYIYSLGWKPNTGRSSPSPISPNASNSSWMDSSCSPSFACRAATVMRRSLSKTAKRLKRTNA